MYKPLHYPSFINIIMSISLLSLKPQPHVLFFPYLARGHILPILDLSLAFSSRGFIVTIVTTPNNAPFILSNIPSPHISLSIIPFPSPPVSGLPEGCENTHDLPSPALLLPFLHASSLLRDPFHALLQDMSSSDSLPTCVVSDIMHFWTLNVCRSFGVPRLGVLTGGVLPMTILRTAFLNHSPTIFSASLQQPISIDLLPKLPFYFRKTDFLDTVLQQDPDNLTPTMGPLGEADSESWGTIINSFDELEGQYIPALQSFYKHPIWCVGPFHLHRHHHENHNHSHPYYMEWLDKKLATSGPECVMYVSFGSEVEMNEEQIEEIVMGLEGAGHPFILVARSGTWGEKEYGEDRLGMVIREWVDQNSILDHQATGAFLSHCGWNSVIESLSKGVPVMGWPIGADQPINAKVVCDGMEAGMMMYHELESEWEGGKIKRRVVGRERIKERVKEMMGGDEGRKVRQKAKEIKREAMRAVAKGGSSSTNLDQVIHRLITSK